MTGRDSIVALGAIVVAIGIAAILLVGSMSATGADGDRQRFFFVNFAGRSAQPIRPQNVEANDVPVPLRAVVPFQRGVSEAARDAAGYLLLMIGVSAVLVLGRDQVLGAYHASRGGWLAQLRVLGTGVAVLLLLASASFLGGVVLLGTVATGFREVPIGIQFGLQVGLMAAAMLGALVGLVALLGFTATAWHLGDAIFGTRPFASWGQPIPSVVVALVGATLLYLTIQLWGVLQLPAVGRALGAAVVAYALGTVIVARLGHLNGRPASTT